jgi:hypothetical protein
VDGCSAVQCSAVQTLPDPSLQQEKRLDEAISDGRSPLHHITLSLSLSLTPLTHQVCARAKRASETGATQGCSFPRTVRHTKTRHAHLFCLPSRRSLPISLSFLSLLRTSNEKEELLLFLYRSNKECSVGRWLLISQWKPLPGTVVSVHQRRVVFESVVWDELLYEKRQWC